MSRRRGADLPCLQYGDVFVAFTWRDEADHAEPGLPLEETKDWARYATTLSDRPELNLPPSLPIPFSLSHVELALAPDSFRSVLRYIGQLCVGFGGTPPETNIKEQKHRTQRKENKNKRKTEGKQKEREKQRKKMKKQSEIIKGK
eukprot:TRINITY_DN40344_c1_g1_i1.p2 TRINITY_DN40344_c1_g1~~TRINITY_DN40344_c1_g1_i1.p2  ORF type:complete len:145 (+),score=11.41 TRINITY_DN40344_c1_g1_i1:272-706(+)